MNWYWICCTWIIEILVYHILVANSLHVCKAFEPPHDKTNKMTVRSVKTQISLGNRPVWSESSLRAQWVAMDPSFLHAGSKDWSDWVDAQADLSLCWVHMSFCWFWHEVAHLIYEKKKNCFSLLMLFPAKVVFMCWRNVRFIPFEHMCVFYCKMIEWKSEWMKVFFLQFDCEITVHCTAIYLSIYFQPLLSFFSHWKLCSCPLYQLLSL